MKTKVFVECGINHNGDIEIAKKIMMATAIAEATACKFQKRNPDKCVPEDQKGLIKDTPWGKMTYLEYKHRMEFSREQYIQLFDFAKLINIDVFASVWDLDSLEFMAGFNPNYLKIPSALITQDSLVIECAKWANTTGKELIISTGMSTRDEVDHCYHLIKEHLPERDQLCIFACNSSYPAKVEELNLRRILTLRELYDAKIGYSGHEEQLNTTVATVMYGVYAIERHVTTDNKRMWGTDQRSSLSAWGLLQLCNGIKDLEAAQGDGELFVYDSEVPFRNKLRGASPL